MLLLSVYLLCFCEDVDEDIEYNSSLRVRLCSLWVHIIIYATNHTLYIFPYKYFEYVCTAVVFPSIKH